MPLSTPAIHRNLPAIVLDRPLIRLAEISILLDIPEFTVDALRLVCESASPPVPIVARRCYNQYFDDMLTPFGAHRLLKIVVRRYNSKVRDRRRLPDSLDRASLLLWMCGLKPYAMARPRPYSRTIEYEIRRISRLKEPQRTIRAIDLMSRYVDASTIAKNAPWKHPAEMEKIEERLEKLCGGSIDV